MTKTNYKGIDYGLGQSNIDKHNGIRYGVLPFHDICQAWCDESEANYGKPQCPQCGKEIPTTLHCDSCDEDFDGDECYPEEAHSHYIDNEEISAEQSGDDTDIFIVKSKYYTRAQFCSPCAPGAGYLRNPCEDGPKTYCFSHHWFTEKENPCPYPVYRVDNDQLVYDPEKFQVNEDGTLSCLNPDCGSYDCVLHSGEGCSCGNVPVQ